MKVMDIKERPQNALESFSYTMNDFTSKVVSAPWYSKKIPVQVAIDVEYIPSEETLEKSYTYFGGNYDHRIAPKKRVFLYTVSEGTNEPEEDQGFYLDGETR